jgi:large subunit ribosomal protein L3
LKALITRKLGMASVISEDGSMLPVTLLSATANTVTQLKGAEKNGYKAIQLGFEDDKKLGKALSGHLKNSKAKSKVVREFRVTDESEASDLFVGSQIEADVFEVGDRVKVTSTSKGKGWAGTIKRHNFKRGRKTHGGRSYRRPGSIGSMYPQKVIKGKRMAGQMGTEVVTTKNLKVALVDKDQSVIGLVGAVPGPKKSIVLVRGA